MKKFKKKIVTRCAEPDHTWTFSVVPFGMRRHCTSCKLTIVEMASGVFGRPAIMKSKNGDVIKKQRL